MSDKEENIVYTAGDIEQYLAGNLLPMQMHAMEKAALDDPFLAEAMEGYQGMKDTEWNNQLIAVRDQIAEKGNVAKVIPLHKSKNNWWKTAAAIFILGSGAAITLLLTKDKAEDKNTPQIAQTITAVTDSVTQINNEPSPSVTASLNPTASAAKEEIKITNDAVSKAISSSQGNNQNIAAPVTAQPKPSPQNIAGTVINDDKVIAALPPAANENIKLAEESNAAKQNNDAEALSRQKNQLPINSKKEAALNNFFTAQVVSADNTPLPFTNIAIKKENFGTYADVKGMVRLVSTDSILNIEVKAVGYLPKTYLLRSNRGQTKIVLQEDEVALRDKTVIGKSDVTVNRKTRRATLLTDSVVNVEPADGWDNYNTYVANNLDIPEEMIRRDIHGEVELQFDVKANGTISNMRVNKSLDAAYDEAAKRLILEGPQWKVKKGKKTSANIKVQF